jgi:predicted membrane channel-forming protein YqfA (hemolysin III family)
MFLNFLKQVRLRGLIYAVIAVAGIIYEIFFSKETRPFLVVMYSLVIVIGIFYFLRAPE